ncbi:MAG: NOP5/NOP56 family protein [Candidatus Aenigmatarchaeota archaeon]
MAVYLAKCPLGFFVFDEQGRFLGYSKDEKIKKRFKDIIEDNTFLRKGLRNAIIKAGLAKSDLEINIMLNEAGILSVKQKLRQGRKENIAKPVVGMIEQIDKNLNSFVERFREWYGLHFPELTKVVTDNERFVQLVAEGGSRDKIKGFENLASTSAGMEFSPQDVETARAWAGMLAQIFEQRKALFKYLEKICKETMPNLYGIAGAFIAAKLLEHAGSLEKLAKMPASTIQLLGAEKALFRHLKEKAKVPKYGIIFLHPFVQHAKPENRGKVARLLAAKLSLAARIDYFSKEDRSAELKKDLEEEIKKLS